MNTTPKIKKAPSSSGASDSIDAAFANVTDVVRSAVSSANLPKPKPKPAPKISDIKPYLAKELKPPKTPDRMYYDVQRGFVAVGYLHKLDTFRDALKLKFSHKGRTLPPGSVPTYIDIEFKLVKLSKGKEVSNVFLPNGQVDVLLKKDIERYLSVLSSQFKDLNTFPTTVQTALVLMAFSLGGTEILLRAFKNFVKAIQNQEWNVAASESSMRSGGSLNSVVKKLFLDAHTTQKKQKPMMPFAQKIYTRRLSGKHWVQRYEPSIKLEDLNPGFRKKVENFIKMLKDNGAKTRVISTLRPAQRAYLMHWSWRIAKGHGTKYAVKYGQYPTVNSHNIDIIWDHGDEKTSVAKAKEMVTAYGIGEKNKEPPGINSRHIEGKAIDLKIWNLPKKLKFKKRKEKKDEEEIEVNIESSADPDLNPELIKVAKKYFDLIRYHKPKKDRDHWSDDGT